MREQFREEAVKLLQQLIQNACVNDGSEGSGNEMRSVNTLIEYFKERGVLDSPNVSHKIYETGEGRGNLLVRLKGRGGENSVAYESHLDVVPVNPEGWDVDPFAAEIKDDFLYGRGALDMLIFTATQAVAFAHLVEEGFIPESDLVFLAVSDEEMGGEFGAKWLVENAADEIRTKYLVGEFGGAVIETPKGMKTGVMIAEKGPAWFKMTVKGTPSHASFSFMVDNALNEVAEIIEKIRRSPPPAVITDSYRRFVKGLELGFFKTTLLTNTLTLEPVLRKLAKTDMGMARTLHALTHMTINPTIIKGGVKVNIISDKVELYFDVRLLPGQDFGYVEKYLRETLGDEVMSRIEIEPQMPEKGTEDPWDTEFISTLSEVYQGIEPGIEITPLFLPAVTDARFFRKIGIICYGFAIMTDKLDLKSMMEMAHGNNEKVPLEAVEKTTLFFYEFAKQFLA